MLAGPSTNLAIKVKIIPSVIPWNLEQIAAHHDLLPFLLDRV